MEVIVSWQRSPEQGAEWTAFPREASAAIEESFSSGAADHSLVATATSINFATMRDTSGARIRRLTNKIVPDQRWEYQEGSFWMDYSVEQCEQINIAHERGRPQTVLYSGTNGSMAVVVNLLDRTQTNRAANTTSMIRFVISAAPRGEKRLALVSKVMDSASIVPGCTDSCSICLDEFTGSDKETAASILPYCSGHFFHRHCMQQQLERRGKCAVCSYFYIVTEGTQPKSGTMKVCTLPAGQLPLASFQGIGTIVIEYEFPSGVQGPEHPNPGAPYYGTYRTAFLPDSTEGREVLGLLQRCFDLRHTFAVGTSLTTGWDNCIVWNGVHHKTAPSGGVARFGWPDPTYFMRVKEELKARGIE